MTRIAKLLLLLCGLLAVEPALARNDVAPPVSEVMVVATMHGLHQTSPTYSYEDLYRLIASFGPDFVGVEIRAEDISRPDQYLASNYPVEMIALARRYGEHAFGFDWLGGDLAGRPVPAGWWKNDSPIKQLERELDADPDFQSDTLDAIQQRQQAILEGASAASLNDGRYDAATEEYYGAFGDMVAGSRYARLAFFYAERDRRIAEAVASFISAHPGKRVVVVLGADHRGAVADHLAERFGSTIHLVPVP